MLGVALGGIGLTRGIGIRAGVALGGGGGVALRQFTKLGTKLSTPSWLSATGNELMYPRLFHNDAYRASLSSLPASSYSVLYSSDHSSGTGYIGRVDFDDIEGAWSDSGAAIYSAASQLETPHPVYDSANNRILVYVHSNTASGETYNTQHTQFLTTTDLSTLSSLTSAIPYGQHSGYAQVEYRNGQFEAWHGMTGGEHYLAGHSTSPDGEAWTFDQLIHPNQSHVVGTGNMIDGVPFYFEYGGQWYGLGVLSARPRSSNAPTALIAYPVETATWRPTGGYYTLVEPGGPTDDDATLGNYYSLYAIGGALYLLYIGIDSGGTQHICLAKGDGDALTQSTPLWAINADGTLTRGTTEAVSMTYDATGVDDLPAWLQVVVQSGTNQSSHTPGSYYELATSATLNANLHLRTVDTYNPTDYETIELTMRGLTLAVAGVTEGEIAIQFGALDDLSTGIDGAMVHWQNEVDPGDYRGFINGVQSDALTYSVGWLSIAPSVSEWMRSNARDVTFRIHDYGNRLTVLLDGHVAYHRDIGAEVAWNDNIFLYLRMRNFAAVQVWARFEQFEVKAWT